MTFSHPYLLLTLLVVPAALAAYVLVQRRRARYALRFTNLEVLAQILPRRSWKRHVPLALFLLALATLCAALSRPHVKTLVARENATVILVVDTSGSMQAEDVKPTRLGAAQAAVRKFLDRVPKRMRVGLISFAGEAQVAAPPTTDHDLVRQAVDDLGVFDGFGYGGGTAIGDAIAAAVDLAHQNEPADGTIAYHAAAQAPRPSGSVSILFLSDGHQTRGYLQPLEGAARAKAASIPVNTIALGTPDGVLYPRYQGFDAGPIPVPPDPATLRAIAEATGGQFFATRSAAAVESAYRKLGSTLGREPGRSEVTYAFLAGAAAVLLIAGLLSALWSSRLP